MGPATLRCRGGPYIPQLLVYLVGLLVIVVYDVPSGTTQDAYDTPMFYDAGDNSFQCYLLYNEISEATIKDQY